MASSAISNLDLLATLDAANPLAAADAVRDCTVRLREGGFGLAEAETLVAKIVALSAHENARIRQAVAEAMPHLSEPVFDRLLAHFATDENPYVRDAVELAERQHSALRRRAADGVEEDQRVARWYSEIEAKGLRLTTQRIAAYEREYFVRRMCHEAGAAYASHADAVKKLRELGERPEIDRAELRALVDRVEERFAFVQHVLAAGKEHANAQAIEPTFRSENLRALVADEAALVKPRFADCAARIAVDFSGVDETIVIDADAGFLRQAFGNILKNAVEAYDGRGDGDGASIAIRVTASVVGAGREVVIAFADRGKGMRPEELERAFVPFASVKKGGTGFGLFIAQRVARNVHGGELAIESEVGVGTTVTMTLPVRQEMAAGKKGRASGARVTRGKRG